MWMKLNLDGLVVARRIAVRGVIRENNGRLVVAYARSGYIGSNNEFEALDYLWGMRIGRLGGIDMLGIEGDSLLTINAIKGVGNGS